MKRLHFHLQVIMLLQVHISNSLFFHERSHIELIPDSRVQETFGFSLAYQNRSFGNIVSGAPHSDRVGKVFNCPLNEVNNSRTIHCMEAVIDVNGLAPYDQDYAPSVKLNLGYSISATDDYFFTCAPLWTSVARSKYYIFGTCFVYNDTAYRYNGLLEQLGDNTEAKIPAKIVSGNGWRTLVDRDSDMLLIGKVSRLSDKSDLTYVSALDPLAPVTSFMTPTSNKDNVIFRFQKYRNLGIAMTAGKFFDKRTMYAISSMDTNTNKGVIHFMYARISKRDGIKKLYQLENTVRSKHVAVFDDKPPGYEAGSMFGVAMSSADLNLDGLDELLVGAPAWDDKEEGGYETGAVHIYLGGDLNHINDVKRRRLVLGNKEGSRFGAAIAASDIDGDNIPEIFVSAPYEDLGKGALYILSGFEINRAIMKTIGFSKIFISQLKLSQRIQNENFKAFGYSLQIVPDIDGNGCNELAVGSPESQNIMLLRCLPSLNVTVEAIHVGDQLVKEQDNSFTIKVCVNVQNLHEVTFSATFIIKNKIMGNKVYIDNGQTELRMIVFGKDKIISKCAEIVVKLGDNEPGAYEFYTTVDIDEEKIMNMSDFDPSRALLSPYSKMSARVDVSRRCTGSDCEPNLSMDLTWSGGIIRNATDLSYDLGSSELLTASLVVTNEGNSSWKSCAVMSVSGATVAQIGCVEKMGQYTCYMSYPLKRFSKYPIDIKLNMSQPTNENEEIEIHALLYDYCNTDSIPKEKKWYMKLNFKTDDVELTGSSHDQTVSDTRIEDQREPTIKDAHEYWVENKGNVTWNIKALVNINEEPFITIYRVSSAFGDCTKEDLPPKQIFSCQLNLPPRSKAKVIASADIAKDKILENLKDKKLSVQSKFSLFLYPSSTILTKSLSTSIIFRKEQSFAQNKGLIIFLAVLGAAIALGLIIFVLYKVNFFIRTEKTKLDVLKQEHIRRQSVKRSMSLGNDEAGLDMEIDDDSPFEIIDMTEPVLQEDEKPQSSK